MSASAVAFDGLREPVALDEAGIATVIDDFRTAARRAVEAGFDLVEVHAAHGYLVHQFLSPLSNRRTDEWGGTLENRARLLLEIVRAVRAEVGEAMPVFVRFSATDWTPGGWDEAQTATVAGWASAAGADFFDISTGGLVASADIPIGPAYQAHFAEYVGERSDVPVSAVGRITNARHADDLVAARPCRRRHVRQGDDARSALRPARRARTRCRHRDVARAVPAGQARGQRRGVVTEPRQGR